MRLIVNAISAHTGGNVTYTNNLLNYFADAAIEAIVFLPAGFDTRCRGSSSVRLETTEASRLAPLRRFLWEQRTWRRIVAASGADIVFSSANYGLLNPPLPQVLLVQGEISFNPLYRKKVLPRLGVGARAAFALRRRLVLRSARDSDAVIFPSETALRSVVGDDADLGRKSRVNYLAGDSDLAEHTRSRSWREDGTLRLLYVSIYYPHKDPLTLVRAARRLAERGVDTHATITMEARDFALWRPGPAEWRALVREKAAGGITLGRLPHAQVGASLAGHDVMVSPSLAETFGFPLVEAMTVGIPVLASDTAVHREICGDAAIYFEPGNDEHLARRLFELDADAALRDGCRRRGKERVGERFTWERHMRELIGCFEQVLARP